jgi:hypothetical protein
LVTLTAFGVILDPRERDFLERKLAKRMPTTARMILVGWQIWAILVIFLGREVLFRENSLPEQLIAILMAELSLKVMGKEDKISGGSQQCQYARFREALVFRDILRPILSFCCHSAEGIRQRCLPCGLCPLENELAVNTSTPAALVSCSKSCSNAMLIEVDFVTSWMTQTQLQDLGRLLHLVELRRWAFRGSFPAKDDPYDLTTAHATPLLQSTPSPTDRDSSVTLNYKWKISGTRMIPDEKSKLVEKPAASSPSPGAFETVSLSARPVRLEEHSLEEMET